MNKILFVTQKRSDAIGIVDKNILESFQNFDTSKEDIQIEFLELHLAGKGLFGVWINYFGSMFRLIPKMIGKDLVILTWPSPLIFLLRFIFMFKDICMFVYHIEGSWITPTFTKIILWSASYFIVSSEYTKQDLIDKWGIEKELIQVVYLGVSKNYYPDKCEPFLPFKYFLYVGDEYSRKNMKGLLYAFKRLVDRFPDIKLVKVGRVQSYKDKVKTDSIIHALKLEKNVRLKREFMSEETLRSYYSNALACILPSFLEGFGMSIPESMACGCPVLISNRKPMTELAGEHQLRFAPDDIDDITSTMERIVLDAKLAERLSKDAILQSKRFAWSKTRDQIYDFIKILLPKNVDENLEEELKDLPKDKSI